MRCRDRARGRRLHRVDRARPRSLRRRSRRTWAPISPRSRQQRSPRRPSPARGVGADVGGERVVGVDDLLRPRRVGRGHELVRQLEHRHVLALDQIGGQVGDRPAEIVEDQRAARPVDAALAAAVGDQLERLGLAVHAADEDALGVAPVGDRLLECLVGTECPGIVDTDQHRQVRLLLEERFGGVEPGRLVDRLGLEGLHPGRRDGRSRMVSVRSVHGAPHWS